MSRLKTLIILLSLIISVSVIAQRERNYIYLLDCTRSMTGVGNNPNIWQPTKDYLKNDLVKHTTGTTLHVIPFQDKVLRHYNFEAGKYKWNDIEKELDGFVTIRANTNICAAWDAIDGHLDLHKDNYVILLTDGQDNINGMDAVVEKLRDWCGKYPNTYAFYVQLTQAAIDTRVAKVINLCDNEFVVDASKGKGIPVFGSFDKGLVIHANTLNLKKVHRLGFSAAGEYGAKVTCSDPYFDVKIPGDKIKNGIVPIQINAKKSITEINAAIPQTYEFTFDVKSGEVDIINPKVKVLMTNKPERVLETISEETDMGKATWYDSFLFWGESSLDTLNVDLKAFFNDEAHKDGSIVELFVSDPDGGKDFQLFLAGHKVENGKIILSTKNEGRSILSIVFNPDAKEGSRYLTVKAQRPQKLDKINDEPVDKYTLSLRSKYFVVWNPLKTILMWIGILILAALILWFLIIKHFLYPTIGVKTIQINDPYFSKVNVKGKRRVVFTNVKMKQGLLSRIFTGEILYKKNEVWSSPLAFECGAKKKTLRVMRTKDYTFDPYTSILKAPNDYVVENVNDKTKIKITIN